jgi:hypothetical protein
MSLETSLDALRARGRGAFLVDDRGFLYVCVGMGFAKVPLSAWERQKPLLQELRVAELLKMDLTAVKAINRKEGLP